MAISNRVCRYLVNLTNATASCSPSIPEPLINAPAMQAAGEALKLGKSAAEGALGAASEVRLQDLQSLVLRRDSRLAFLHQQRLLQFYERLSPTVAEYIDRATPYVKGAYTEASKILVPFANDVASKGVPIVTVRPRMLNQSLGLRVAVCDIVVVGCKRMMYSLRLSKFKIEGSSAEFRKLVGTLMHLTTCTCVQEGTKNLLKSSGVDVDSLTSQAGVATKTVTDVSAKATPTVNKVVNFLSISSPETLGKIGIVLVAVYYLTPFALKTAVSSFRGYAGAFHTMPLETLSTCQILTIRYL